MRVCHGLAGDVVEVDDLELQWKKPIDLAKHYASERWRVDAGDVIALASSGGTVGPGLGTEGLGESRDIFIFLRSVLDPRAEVPSEPLAVDLFPGDDRIDKHQQDEVLSQRAECADPAFEAFRSNIEEAHRVLLETQPVAALTLRVEARLEVQRLAGEAVLQNLMNHVATCSRSMALLAQKFQKVHRSSEQNCAGVEASMAELVMVQLHPAMQRPGQASLADIVPRQRILQFTANLEAERRRLAQRLDKLRKQDQSLKTLCEKVEEHMKHFLQEDEVTQAARKIRDDHATAEQKLLPELRALVPHEGATPPSILEEEKRSAGVLEGLARICRGIRAQRLPELQARWDQRYSSFLQCLREVSYVQSKVRDIESQAALLEEEINVQRDGSQKLGHLKKMPKAYQRMLHEIARRRHFQERYQEKTSEMRSSLGRMAEEENVRRRAFLQRYGAHLPVDLARLLGSWAPPVAVDVPEFDSLLPNIDFSCPFDAEQPAGVASSARPSAGSRPTANSIELGASASPSASSTKPAYGGSATSPATATVSTAPHSGPEDGGTLSSHRDAALSSRERGSSTSSCSSSLRSPWPVGSSVKGVGSGNSSGPPTQRSPERSMTPSVQGEELSSGSQNGSLGQAAARRVGELESRNRDLEARIAGLVQEMAHLRGSAAVASAPAQTPTTASTVSAETMPARKQDVASVPTAAMSTAESGTAEGPATNSATSVGEPPANHSSEVADNCSPEGDGEASGDGTAEDEAMQGADSV